MARILVLYSTTDGHTRKICDTIASQLEADGHALNVVPIADYRQLRLEDFDKIVVGASIRYGNHHPQVIEFANSQAALLAIKPSALFSVNIVARKPNKNTPQTNPYLRKLLKRISWQPKLLGVFAGKLNYPIYGPLDRLMIRFIMLITKGPTDPSTVVEFTDWQKVAEFAAQVNTL